MSIHPLRSNVIASALILFFSFLVQPVSAFSIGDLLDSGPSENGNGRYVHLEDTFRDDGTDVVSSIVWSPDGRYIASTGYVTKSLHIWDVWNHNLVKNIVSPDKAAYDHFSLAWSPDGRFLATCHGTVDEGMYIYDTSDWHVVKKFKNSEFLCQMVRYSTDGQEVAAIRNKTLATIDANTWQIKKVIQLPPDGRETESPHWEDITYIPNTHTLAIAGSRFEKSVASDPCASDAGLLKYTARVWWLDTNDVNFQKSLSLNCKLNNARNISSIRFHPNGHQFAVIIGSYDRKDFPILVGEFTYPEGEILSNVYSEKIDGTPNVLRYTTDGKYLLIGIDRPPNRHGQLDIMDTSTGRIVDSVRVAFTSKDIAVNAQSTAFAVATGNGFKVWKFLK